VELLEPAGFSAKDMITPSSAGRGADTWLGVAGCRVKEQEQIKLPMQFSTKGVTVRGCSVLG